MTNSKGRASQGNDLHTPEGIPWVTLREASERVGVAVSTIRKWYGSGDIESRLEAGPYGQQRMVNADEVMERSKRGRRAGGRKATGGSAGSGPASDMVPMTAWRELQTQWIEAQQHAQEAEIRAKVAEFRVEQLEEQLAAERGRRRFRRIKPTE